MNVYVLFQIFCWASLGIVAAGVALFAVPCLTAIVGYAAGFLAKCFLTGFGKGLEL